MQGVSPVILLLYDPPPVPSVVCELEVVGLPPVFQQTPRAVTVELQSPDIVPPDDADVELIEETDVVVIDGETALEVKERSAPYAV